MTDSNTLAPNLKLVRERLPEAATTSRNMLDLMIETAGEGGIVPDKNVIGAIVAAIVQLEFEVKGIHVDDDLLGLDLTDH